MRRSKSEIYFHLVWTTWQRQPFLTEEIEREVHRCIRHEVERLKGTTLAVNGMPDHVHLVARVPTSVSAAKLAQQVKGVSSMMIRDQLCPDSFFRWQEGFGVFSLSRPDVARVVRYVDNQKQHHLTGKLWPEWEESDEPAGP